MVFGTARAGDLRRTAAQRTSAQVAAYRERHESAYQFLIMRLPSYYPR